MTNYILIKYGKQTYDKIVKLNFKNTGLTLTPTILSKY